MNVPFLDLKAGYLEFKEEIDAAVIDVLNSGQYILGSTVEAFEAEFASYVETEFCIGVGNGLDALILGLRALGVAAGDEVIVPSNTYIATWLAVSELGGIPVAVEPDERTYNIDSAKIEAAITEKTKVIIPVHLYGQPADMDAVLAVARQHGLKVLEDAAQAQGARYKGRRIGGHADLVAWSFYPGKNLGAFGDAGALTTNDAQLADQLKLLRNYGSAERYRHDVKGRNSRLDPIQAAVLNVKLKYLDEWNQRRKDLAKRYLKECSGAQIGLPYVPDWADPVWHLFVIQTDFRELLQARFQQQDIATLIHYPIPPHLQNAYKKTDADDLCLPIAESMAGQILSLPIGPHLSFEAQDIVIRTLLTLKS